MNRLDAGFAVPAAATAVPLAIAALLAPAGLDAAVHPALAFGLPLSVAIIASAALQVGFAGAMAAAAAALPFSAWALATYSNGPIAVHLCTAAALAIAIAAASPRASEGAKPRLRAAAALTMLAAMAPGAAAAALLGPVAGFGTAALSASIALLTRFARRR